MIHELDLTCDHVHVFWSDTAATERWFTTCLGAELLTRRPNKGVPASDLRLGGITILIRGPRPDEALANPGPRHFGNDHFGFRVRDLASTVAELKGRGVTFTVEPYEARPGLRVAFIKGPDDVLIELLQYDE